MAKKKPQVIIEDTRASVAVNQQIVNLFDIYKNTSTKRAAQTNGWSTAKDQSKPSALKGLIEYISKTLADITGEEKGIAWWLVSIDDGGAIQEHDHNQSDWAAVYYPQDVTSGGVITFESGETVEPKAGLLIMFPGTLKHSVSEYTGEGPRLSVAFNRV